MCLLFALITYLFSSLLSCLHVKKLRPILKQVYSSLEGLFRQHLLCKVIIKLVFYIDLTFCFSRRATHLWCTKSSRYLQLVLISLFLKPIIQSLHRIYCHSYTQPQGSCTCINWYVFNTLQMPLFELSLDPTASRSHSHKQARPTIVPDASGILPQVSF
jgi:hypothetical protein